MLCDNCSEHEATFHFQECRGKTRKTLHLCKECAAAKGLSGDAQELGKLGLAALLYKMAKDGAAATATPAAEPDTDEAASRACPGCGLTAKDFRTSARLGCAQCYETFSAELTPLLASLHRNTRHVGKRPGQQQEGQAALGRVLDICSLREELARAVVSEAYERAAELRDLIQRATARDGEEGAAP